MFSARAREGLDEGCEWVWDLGAACGVWLNSQGPGVEDGSDDFDGMLHVGVYERELSGEGK